MNTATILRHTGVPLSLGLMIGAGGESDPVRSFPGEETETASVGDDDDAAAEDRVVTSHGD